MSTHQHGQEHGQGHGHHEDGHGGGHGHGHGAYDPSQLQRSDAFFGDVYRQIIAWLNIKPGTTALEAGSGAGGVTELLSDAVGASGGVTALDATPELLQTAKDRMDASPFKDRVAYQDGDIQHLPFEDKSFDLAWSSRTVHHLDDQLAGVRELRRVLKPGGVLALREGGMRPRFLPTDIGLGEPGLEDRLDVAFDRWFHVSVRSGEGAVAYPYGWTQLLRDAGLKEVTAKTFLLELLPPFSGLQVEYMTGLLLRWLDNEERRTYISVDDADALTKLTDPPGAHYAFNRSDLHYIEGITVYTGRA